MGGPAAWVLALLAEAGDETPLPPMCSDPHPVNTTVDTTTTTKRSPLIPVLFLRESGAKCRSSFYCKARELAPELSGASTMVVCTLQD
jgi:hypothetical protein